MLSRFVSTVGKSLVQPLSRGVQTSKTVGAYAVEYDPSEAKYQEYNTTSPVWSCNEWDPLEEIIVGRYENACVPPFVSEFTAVTPSIYQDFFKENASKYWADVLPKEYWKNLTKEVDEFVRILECEGVKVRRPDVFDYGKEFKTPYFQSKGLDGAMLRDFVAVIADEIVESTMTWRSRYFEYMPLRSVFKDYWRQGAKWTAAPKPVMDKSIAEDFELEIIEGYQDEPKSVITNHEPLFDAADLIKCGRDIFMQRSQVTNSKGIEWLRRHLAPRGIRVHELSFGNPIAMHIDVSFYPILPGYVLVNPELPCQQKDIFEKCGWKFIDVTEYGFDDSQHEYFGHRELAMNNLIISPTKVIVEAQEEAVIKIYESLGMECIRVPFQHAFAFGGSFHCWTTDVRRQGKLESYF